MFSRSDLTGFGKVMLLVLAAMAGLAGSIGYEIGVLNGASKAQAELCLSAPAGDAGR